MLSLQNVLPAFGSYKLNCHHSTYSWVCYQSSHAQLRLIEFHENLSIRQSIVIEVPGQPIKCIRIMFDEQEQTVYVGIAFIGRYMVLRKNVLVSEIYLPLDCNIVDYMYGFTSCDVVNDGKQIYFVFVTANADVYTLPVNDPENRKIISTQVVQGKDRVSSICTNNGNAYLGTENGLVIMFDLNIKKIIGKYDTMSKLPILKMQISNNLIVLTTCKGDIHTLDKGLGRARVVAAHSSMITLLHLIDSKLYTFGDDCYLREFEIDNEGKLFPKRSNIYTQKGNLIFSLFGHTFLNFYEEKNVIQI